MEKKAEDAKKSAEKLAENIPSVKDFVASKQKQKPAAASTGSEKKRAASSDAKAKSPASKKPKAGKKSPPPSAADAESKPDPAVDPQSVVGMRIGKFFQDSELYFGKIESFYKATETDDRVDLWNIVYDDGDVEDFELGEVQQGLEIYANNKDRDENAP